MTAPLFVTTEKHHSALPLLLIDKQGVLSKGLTSILSEHFTTVLVSEKQPLPHLERVVHVPFRRRIPAIPNDYFLAIILFYQGEAALKDSLHSFLKKAKENNAKFMIVTSLVHAEEPAIKKVLETYEESYLLLYGDIFGISPHEDALATHMVHEASKTGKITVGGSGLQETYPVYYADVLQGILHVLLSHRGSRVTLLFPKTPVAQIHLARLVTKLFPHASIVFKGQELKEQASRQVPEGEVVTQEPYPLGEKLKHLAVFTKAGGVKLRPHATKRQRSHKALLRWGVLAGILLAIVPFLTFGFFLFGLLSLSVTQSAGLNGDLPLVMKRAESAKSLFHYAEQSAGPVLLLSQPVGLGDYTEQYLHQLRMGKIAADVAWHAAGAGLAYQPIAKSGNTDSQQAMLAVSSHLKQAILGIGQLRSDSSFPEKYKAELVRLESPIRRVSGIIESLPYLTGVAKEQTYLVLFQNNMELRPGGGFIGSYGLLTMKGGRIATFTIHDVYDADGRLTGHVEPPFGLGRYLGASHLFLRDSNFGVEFEDNAALAATLLHLSTDERVDGVVTMDVSFLRSLLRTLGPVYLPVYNETVNADNFYLSAQTHAEKDFFPGSTQKKDFLQHVAQALLLSFEEREEVPYAALLQAVDQAITQKHLMVASSNSGLMTMLAKNGFAPSITATAEERSVDVADFIGVFDANVGANKANYYIKRTFSQRLHLQSTGEQSGEMTIRYVNSSTETSPFGGDYKNFLQVVLPETAVLTAVQIDGEEQEIVPAVTNSRVFTFEDFAAPQGLEVEEQVLLGRRVYGFFVVIPKGSAKTVIISYQVPAERVLPERFSYMLRVYKQPGTDFDPYRLVLTTDPTLAVHTAPEFASQVSGAVRVTRELAEDIVLPMEFMRQ